MSPCFAPLRDVLAPFDILQTYIRICVHDNWTVNFRVLQQNSDVCTACSGSGKLICCVGCWGSFLLICLDPPMTSDAAENIEGKCYCYKCKASRSVPPLVERGVFGELTSELNKKNPTAFHLPPAIRDYFDGVKTGDEGEYADEGVARANK